MIPGEMFVEDGMLELNAGRVAITLEVANTGDRPVQVGSHYHFAEANPALDLTVRRRGACGSTLPQGRRCALSPDSGARSA